MKWPWKWRKKKWDSDDTAAAVTGGGMLAAIAAGVASFLKFKKGGK